MNSFPTPSALGLVALGGGLGAALRLVATQLAAQISGTAVPWGTFGVNVIGGLAMGLVVGWGAAQVSGPPSALKLFLTTGVLGGFTTFSAFSLELVVMLEAGQGARAMAYATASVLCAGAAVYAGLFLAKLAT